MFLSSYENLFQEIPAAKKVLWSGLHIRLKKRGDVFCAMDIQMAAETLMTQLRMTSTREWIAVVFGVLQVLLAWKNNVLLYPAGIISTIFSVYILTDVKLYAEAFLNVYYLLMSVYGWVHWLRRRNEPALPITRTNKYEWAVTMLIVAAGWACLYCILRRYTPSDVPAWDAFVSSTAWAGMWLLARRKLENWILLNISNFFAVPLQFHKQIPLYALLTIVLFVVAIFGYFNWRKLMKAQINEKQALNK